MAHDLFRVSLQRSVAMKRWKATFTLIFLAGCFLSVTDAIATCSNCSTLAASCTAGSSVSQVNTCLGSLPDGGTITLANGTYNSWTSSLSFSASKGASVVCESVGGCTVNGGGPLWQWANWGTTDKLYRISGFVFNNVTSYYIWLYGTGTSKATMTKLRIDHNHFKVSNNGSDIITFGEVSGVNTTIFGVIDNNTFTTTTGNTRWIVNYCQTNASWPSNRIGTINNLFIEDNTFNDQCTTNAGNALLTQMGDRIVGL